MSDALTSLKGSLFIQKTPGVAPEYFGCADLDALNKPAGDQGLIQCHDQNGNFVTVGETHGAPAAVTTSLTALVFPEADALDFLGKCRVNLYITQDGCGRKGVLSQYDRYNIVHHARITQETLDQLVKRVDDAPTTRKLDFSAWTPVYAGRRMTVVRQDIAETTDLNDIAFCNAERCAGDCGAALDICTNGIVVGDSPAGSPASSADVWDTEDGGGAWANVIGHPFAAGEDIFAATCFQIDRETTRWLVTREADPANPMEIGYSDDGGATWTNVNVGVVNGENVSGPHGLFSLDAYHIWMASDLGNVYFSNDGGLTWTLQDSAAASGAAVLWAIRFATYKIGYAVGAGGVIIGTIDGGATWSADPMTDPSGAAVLRSLHVFDKYRFIVGDGAGNLWQTWDQGVTWTEENFTGTGTGIVMDVAFANEYEGFMLHDTVALLGSIHKTIDGGATWERLTTPTNLGLNALWVCHGMLAFAVGNASGGTGVILKASG